MGTIYKDIEVEFDTDDFTDQELLDELRDRDLGPLESPECPQLLDKIYHARRQGKSYEALLDHYLYLKTGHTI